MFSVVALEMDITHVCNLHCDGCTHFSNYALKGHIDPEDARGWLNGWARRVEPDRFTILGGEPSLHPRMTEFIRMAHAAWPRARRVLVSNGFFLHRHPDLARTLAETDTELEISIHSNDPEYREKLNEAVHKAPPESLGIKAGFRNSVRFYRTYLGHGATMRPYDDRAPERAWAVCENKECMTIFRGRLWKCPPLAFLKLVADRFDLWSVPDWQPYLGYQGIGLDASDEELEAFLGRQAEAVCAMCPATLEWKEKDKV